MGERRRHGWWVLTATTATAAALAAVCARPMSTAASGDGGSGAPTTGPAAATRPSAGQTPDAAPDGGDGIPPLGRPGHGGPWGGGFGGGGLGGPFRGWGGGFGRRSAEPPVEADKIEALQFVAKHAPNFAKAIAELPQGSAERNRLEATVTAAFLNYRQLQFGQAELYNATVQRIEREDAIYEMTVKLGQIADPAARAPLEAEVRKRVAAWYDATLQERRLRLDRLKQMVQHEDDALTADINGRDERIDMRTNRILNGGGWGGPGLDGRGGRVP